MKTITLDTNILMRYILLELTDEYIIQISQFLFTGKYSTYIDFTTIIEIEYLLIKRYQKNRKFFAEFISSLIRSKNTIMEKDTIKQCLEIYLLEPTISLVDIKNYISAKLNSYFPLYTFDKDLQKFDIHNILPLPRIR